MNCPYKVQGLAHEVPMPLIVILDIGIAGWPFWACPSQRTLLVLKHEDSKFTSLHEPRPSCQTV